MSDDAKKPILLVKKGDSKKGSLWNSLTNKRIIKQHGGFDIPEGDLHAIQKLSSPLDDQRTSPEETKVALSEIEKEIQHLKEKDKRTPPPPPPRHELNSQFGNQLPQNYQDKDDDIY